MIYEAAVDLTIPDNTAFTVLQALRELGYDAVTRVERSELYRLTLSDDGLSRDDVARAVRRAEVIFNPNKHRLWFTALAEAQATARAVAADKWEAVVADRNDDTSRLVRLLTERFGLAGLRSVEQSIAWRLFEDGSSSSKERLEWACSALLCNPSSQTSFVHVQPHRLQVGDTAVPVEP